MGRCPSTHPEKITHDDEQKTNKKIHTALGMHLPFAAALSPSPASPLHRTLLASLPAGFLSPAVAGVLGQTVAAALGG
jgi:hypothetical protein